MKKFTFAIIETLRREVTVEAETVEDAENRVEGMYRNEDIVLVAEDFWDRETRFLREEEAK